MAVNLRRIVYGRLRYWQNSSPLPVSISFIVLLYVLPTKGVDNICHPCLYHLY